MGKIGEIWISIGAKLDNFNKGMNDAQKAMQKVGKRMTAIGSSLTKTVTLPILGVGVAAIKSFGSFDRAMTESLAIMGNVSDSMKKKMADVAKTISEETTYSAKELAEAYYFLASAGMNAEQSVAALGDVARFAQAGAFDLATATDLLTDAQTALGLSSKDAAENQENLIRVSDVLVKANTLANASVQQFSEALTNRAAAALVNVNKELEEGVAILAAYADKGVKGQLAGMRLAMMLNALDKAASKNKDAWDKYGISLFDAQGEMRHMGDIIGDLENALGGMSPELRSAALAQLGFDIRTKASILTLMGSSEKIKQWTKDLKKAGGTTDIVAKKQMKAFNNQMKAVWNSIVNLAASIGEQLAPALIGVVDAMKPLIKFAAGLVEKFGKLPGFVKTIAIAFVGLLAAVGPVLLIFGKILTVLPSIILAIKVVAAKFLVFKAALLVLTGPIGLVIAAIAALAAAAYLIVKNWKHIKAFFVGLWKGIEAAIGPILKKIFDIIIYPFKKIVEFLKNVAPKIIDAITYPFKTAWKFVKDTFVKVAKWILDKFLWLGEQLAKIPLVKKFVKGFKEGMEEVRRSMETTETVVTERGMKMAEAFVKAAKKTDIWRKANKLLGGALDKLGTKTGDLNEEAGGLEEKLEDVGDIITTTAVPAMNDLRGVVYNMRKTLKGADFKTPFDKMIEGIYKARDAAKIAGGEITKSQQQIADEAELAAERAMAAWEEHHRHWLQLCDNLGGAFGNFAEGVLDKGSTLKENLQGLWDDILGSFKRMIGDMVAEWATNFLKNTLLDLTAKTADEAADKVVSTFTDAGKKAGEGLTENISSEIGGIGKIISDLGKGIGAAIKAIGEGIAAGAKAVAAAAPAIMKVAAMAIAIYAGFKVVSGLIGKIFGGGKGTGAQDYTNKILLTIRDHIGAQSVKMDMTNEFLAGFYGKYDTMLDELYKIRDATEGTLGILPGLGEEKRVFGAMFESGFSALDRLLSNINQGIQGILKALTSQGTVYVDVFRSGVFEGVGEKIAGQVGSLKEGTSEGLKQLIAQYESQADKLKNELTKLEATTAKEMQALQEKTKESQAIYEKQADKLKNELGKLDATTAKEMQALQEKIKEATGEEREALQKKMEELQKSSQEKRTNIIDQIQILELAQAREQEELRKRMEYLQGQSQEKRNDLINQIQILETAQAKAIAQLEKGVTSSVGDVVDKIGELEFDTGGIIDAVDRIKLRDGFDGGIEPVVPEYQHGGVVPRTGIVKLHEGETVIPKGGAGGNITIAPVFHISAMDTIGVRDFIRKKGLPEIIEAVKNSGTLRTRLREAQGN